MNETIKSIIEEEDNNGSIIVLINEHNYSNWVEIRDKIIRIFNRILQEFYKYEGDDGYKVIEILDRFEESPPFTIRQFLQRMIEVNKEDKNRNEYNIEKGKFRCKIRNLVEGNEEEMILEDRYYNNGINNNDDNDEINECERYINRLIKIINIESSIKDTVI
ncbi:hypothetical protein DAPK24_026310 [Pichia kluyveri]|uniref:Uncharacterized protein n=1 Tax=Pichia kluyveri TaxID=36015 RepID=A0AAV5R472_PICKL|nr:hypothetical protein DAPK24_026310 [Pichia kluyveri]